MYATLINLDRRPDRLEDVGSHLSSLGLDFARIEAVDAQGFAYYDTNPIRAAEVACWKSHAQAHALHAESQDEYRLVLEDDALFLACGNLTRHSRHPMAIIHTSVANFLEGASRNMETFGLDILQIGYIESVYSLRGRQGLGYVLSEFMSGRRPTRWVQDGFKTWLWRDQFRVGTHAYIVNRKAAIRLRDANESVDFAADDFLGYLAKYGATQRSNDLRIGCLQKSIVSQRYRSDSNPDSDISLS